MQGYILSNLIISPPLFEIIFFPQRTSLRRAGRSPDRRQTAKIFGVYDPKRCIFKAFSPVFLCNFRRISVRQGGAGGVGRPPAEIFEVYNPKRCLFPLFFLPFSFPTSSFSFFSPSQPIPPPPPYHSILDNISP